MPREYAPRCPLLKVSDIYKVIFVSVFLNSYIFWFISGDCPIFYKRKKVQKDLGEAQEGLDRFTITTDAAIAW
jgi:hypothetical protein